MKALHVSAPVTRGEGPALYNQFLCHVHTRWGTITLTGSCRRWTRRSPTAETWSSAPAAPCAAARQTVCSLNPKSNPNQNTDPDPDPDPRSEPANRDPPCAAARRTVCVLTPTLASQANCQPQLPALCKPTAEPVLRTIHIDEACTAGVAHVVLSCTTWPHQASAQYALCVCRWYRVADLQGPVRAALLTWFNAHCWRRAASGWEAAAADLRTDQQRWPSRRRWL